MPNRIVHIYTQNDVSSHAGRREALHNYILVVALRMCVRAVPEIFKGGGAVLVLRVEGLLNVMSCVWRGRGCPGVGVVVASLLERPGSGGS
jgi:hypothetical protein